MDVLKVEVPVNMKFVEGASHTADRRPTRKKEAHATFPQGRRGCDQAVHLSFGRCQQRRFSETLELAGESGVKFNGVLCGRATWKEGIPVYAKQGAGGFPQVAGNRRREEYRERQCQVEGCDPVAFDL